jgi:hypothetical protein
MGNTEKFKKWAKSFSGCDGGDIGSHDKKSKWVCGIEWGGGHNPEYLEETIALEVLTQCTGYDSWNENLSYIFNWQVMKLLSVIEGGGVPQYKQFAESKMPFVSGSSGYFKMNLYPFAFKNTSHDLWQKNFASVTGFERKSDYLEWCRHHRFPQLRNWASEYKPELIICLGKTYKHEFITAFGDPDLVLSTEIIDDRELNWGRNTDGTLILVLPFMVNRNGLTKNSSIEKFGKRIRELLN